MKKPFGILIGSLVLFPLISCGGPKTYTVTWLNYDETVLETDTKVKKGETPSYDGREPTRESDETYAYDFLGWEPELTEVSEDVTYVASYQAIPLHKISFVNYDNSPLYEKVIREDEMPEYKGETPIREEDMVNTYSFTGWTPEFGYISEDTTYVAQYLATPIIYYHVTFVNYDDSVLYEVDVREGRDALYGGETPTQPEDDEFTYEFQGWDKDLKNITADVTIKALYKYIGKEDWGPLIRF